MTACATSLSDWNMSPQVYLHTSYMRANTSNQQQLTSERVSSAMCALRGPSRNSICQLHPGTVVQRIRTSPSKEQMVARPMAIPSACTWEHMFLTSGNAGPKSGRRKAAPRNKERGEEERPRHLRGHALASDRGGGRPPPRVLCRLKWRTGSLCTQVPSLTAPWSSGPRTTGGPAGRRGNGGERETPGQGLRGTTGASRQMSHEARYAPHADALGCARALVCSFRRQRRSATH